MTEQMKPNVQPEIHPDGLTGQAQNTYSRGGDIFMDQGQNEQQSRGNTAPAEPRPSQPRPTTPLTPEAKIARDNRIREVLESRDVGRIGQLMDELQDDPELGMQGSEVQERAGRVPEQGAVRRRREEAGERRGGSRATNYLDATGFTDLRLQDQSEAVNHLIDLFPNDPEILRESLQRMLNEVVQDATIPLNERNAFAGQVAAEFEILRLRQHEQQDRLHRRGGGRLDPETIAKLDQIEGMPASTEPEINIKTDAYLEFIRDEISLQRDQPKELFERIIKQSYQVGNKPVEYLVQRIISAPLDAEYSRYDLGFYSRNNLETIIDVVRSESERAWKPDPQLSQERNAYNQRRRPIEQEQMKALYNKINVEREAVVHVHEMNRQIVTGNLEEFIGVSRSITPEQLQILQEVKGVSLAMRLFDQEIQRFRARDGWINDRNYDEIFGKPVEVYEEDVEIVNPETGEVTGHAKRDLVRRKEGTVESYMREINRDLPNGEKMSEWEIRWALNLGRTFINNTLRGAEQISLSEVPHGSEGIGGFPQEIPARLVNWIGKLVKRFNVSESRGAQDLLNLMIEAYQHQRHDQGYHTVHIEKIGGVELEQFEMAGMFGGSGIWSSWRQDLIVLEHAPLSGTDTTIRKHLDGFVHPEDTNKPKEKQRTISNDAATLRMAFLDGDELKPGFTNALGILLKIGAITPNDKDVNYKGIRKVKEDIRVAIWKRVAEDNPLAMQTFLDGIEFSEKDKDGKEKLPEGYEKIEFMDSSTKKDTPEWESLRSKLVKAHEKRMRAIHEKLPLPDFDTALDYENLPIAEKAMLDSIRKNGKIMTHEFANIRFPFNPFMNDVLFERVKYQEAGATFYSRRTGGDLPSFHSANQKFMELMTNPGAMHGEKVLEVFLAMVDALGSPMGTDAGQDKIVPFLDGYLEWTEEGGHIDHHNKFLTGLHRWGSKQSLISGLWHTFEKPTSRAQKFYGMNAPSENEEQARTLLWQALSMGILRKGLKDKDGKLIYTDTFERFKKKHKVRLGWLLLALLRDWGPLVMVGAFVELGKSVKDEK